MMDEYMKFGIENHPSISSEYLNFLVTNSVDRGQEGGDLEHVGKMEGHLDEVENLAKGAKSDAGYESNAIDLFKKRVEKMKRKVEKK